MRAIRMLLVAGLVCWIGPTALAADHDFEGRRLAFLSAYTNRALPQGMHPDTWVDSERWCVAHACLETGVRREEANRYFAEVVPVCMMRGLVADTDVQFTDLLWTYMRFGKTDRLSPAARDHLLDLFRAWRVPNPDRNRLADVEYEWPAEYTENHTLNILVTAYLADIVLQRDRDGHAALLLAFLGDRARWGWSEFHSPAYALVTVKVLAMLADAAPDPAVAEAARMHLDLIALDFANVTLGTWRGMPHARGYGSEGNNAGNSMNDVARLWFGGGPAGTPPGHPFLVHLLTASYRPPELAVRLACSPETRGSYEMRKTVTQGPAKQRIPIVAYVTPVVTMASAQGSGSYYDGSYCSISFASSPGAVITARDGKGRNILQRRNVLATFGTVTWHGSLKREIDGNVTIGGDDKAWVGQIDLGTNCHILMVAQKTQYAEAAAFRQVLAGLNAAFSNGVVSWKMPGGAMIQMANERLGDGWRMIAALEDGQPIRLDSNMLFDSPTLRSVRDSGVVEVRDGKVKRVYDFRDLRKPVVRTESKALFTAVPADREQGPLGICLIHIPAGEFLMGSGPGEGRQNERPQRWIKVDGFHISETEITVGQYKQYLAKQPGAKPPPDWYGVEWGKTDAYPITWVSWEEAEGFCRWISATSGRTFRLPTEAEWEKAASGYAHRAYPWGDSYDGTQSGTKNGTYAPAGEHPLDVSPFGVRGLAGNAWEWCADWYGADAYVAMSYSNPHGPERGRQRVLRGCGWNFDPDTFRCSYRSRLEPTERAVHIGFRVVSPRVILSEGGR